MAEGSPEPGLFLLSRSLFKSAQSSGNQAEGCRGVIAAAKGFARSQEENWVANGFLSWRKMTLTSDTFVMAHKSGISIENLLLARRRQRDKILIRNIFINGCRDMRGIKRVFISNTCALLITNDPEVTNGNLPAGRGQKR